MKKYLILIVSLFLLTGCGNKYSKASVPLEDLASPVVEASNGNVNTSSTTSEITSDTTTTMISTTPTTSSSTTLTITTSTRTSASTVTSKQTTSKKTTTTKKVTTKKTTTTTKKTTTTSKKTTSKIATPTDLTEQKANEILLSLKSEYPEGTHWDDNTWSDFHGGNYSGGWGCVGFTYMASDRVFGTLPVKRITDFSKIRVGDIFRYQSSSYGHSVIVLEVKSDRIVVVEGNWQKKVHWNREITFDFMNKYGVYIYTRWPE